MSCIIKVCNGVSRNYMLAFFKLMLGAYGVCHNSFCIINVHTNVTLTGGYRPLAVPYIFVTFLDTSMSRLPCWCTQMYCGD